MNLLNGTSDIESTEYTAELLHLHGHKLREDGERLLTDAIGQPLRAGQVVIDVSDTRDYGTEVGIVVGLNEHTVSVRWAGRTEATHGICLVVIGSSVAEVEARIASAG